MDVLFPFNTQYTALVKQISSLGRREMAFRLFSGFSWLSDAVFYAAAQVFRSGNDPRTRRQQP